jgi:hypothetical protein
MTIRGVGSSLLRTIPRFGRRRKKVEAKRRIKRIKYR